MFFSDKSDLEVLDFCRRSPGFDLVRVEWRHVILNAQADESRPIVDLSDDPLNHVLHSLFGPLSLIELADLIKTLQTHETLGTSFSAESFLKLYQIQWNERLSELFTVLQETPEDFKNWAHSKSMGVRDLQPLLALKQNNFDFLSKLAQSHLSRSEGKQFIDLMVDLILLNKDTTSVLQKEERHWLTDLKALRNPMGTSQEKAPQETSPWPRYVQVVKQRQGDKIMKRMQITYLDDTDLKSKLLRLQKQGELL